MKKTILSVLAILAIVVLVPVAAYASTSQETEISKYVENHDKIVTAKCLVYENNCIVAIKTEKFLNKSEYDQYKENLKQELEDKFDFDHIIVTRSPKAMHAIEKMADMSESEREETIKDLIKKLTSKRPERPAVQPNF